MLTMTYGCMLQEKNIFYVTKNTKICENIIQKCRIIPNMYFIVDDDDDDNEDDEHDDQGDVYGDIEKIKGAFKKKISHPPPSPSQTNLSFTNKNSF